MSETEGAAGALDVLYWQPAHRDDGALAEAIYQNRRVTGVWALDATALLDDYFYYLKQIGVWQAVEKLVPEEGERFLVPFHQLVMLYLAKQACGIRSLNALPDLLFSNEGAMRLLGFNAHQVRQGVCRRGAWRRRSPERQGPVCPEMLAANIAKIGAATVEALFNRAIRSLARRRVLPAHILGTVDATDILTSRDYPGCGSVTRKKHLWTKNRQRKEIEVTVYGWKVWGLMESTLRIPLAVKIAPIQEPDNLMSRALIATARQNLSQWAALETVVFDRGFLDGEDLWWLRSQGLHFVVPAKHHMTACQEAIALASTGAPGEVFPAERIESIPHGQGRERWIEERPTRLVGVPALNTYDQYGPEGHDKAAHRKDFQPHPINAVVIQKFQGQDPEAENPAVLLTDEDVTNPFLPFDQYDDRSLIENCLWRSGKQYWSLCHPPQRTAQGITSHVYLTTMTIALTTCFRLWAEEQRSQLQSGEKLGIERYWRKLAAENACRVIVFLDDAYGIFYLSEVLSLTGLTITDPHPKARSLDELRRQYHLT